MGTQKVAASPPPSPAPTGRAAVTATALTRLAALGLGALGLAAAALLASQLHCAEAEVGWKNDDPGRGDMPGDGGLDGGDDGVHCFTGTATNEVQLLNHCTEAEHVDRPSHIPPTTWDGKPPLP